jgi:hypothetical protein
MVTGLSNILGLQSSQVPHITCILSKFFEGMNPKPSQIIEIGTASGGLSVFLKIAAIQMGGCDFRTYDIREKITCQELFNRLGIEFQKGDVFLMEGWIGGRIQSPGRTVLFCDGGDKAKELNTFSPYLKVGDIILSHDYWDTKEECKQNNSVWKWCEHTLSDIQDSVVKHNLARYEKDLMQSAGWSCFVKE